MKLPHSLLVAATLCSTPVQADNPLTDTFLQPHQLTHHETSWSLSTRAGHNEGSSEMANDGYRLEIPRLTLVKNAANALLFTASIPYLYQARGSETKSTLGDPSFTTTLQIRDQSTLSIGVTEPAANRPLEPDVVRFYAFYTVGLAWPQFTAVLQAGTEIADRYAQEGQDDILTFGVALLPQPMPLRIDLLYKQVVDGRWWDITRPIDSPINRRNATLSYAHTLKSGAIASLGGYVGLQQAQSRQAVAGITVNFR